MRRAGSRESVMSASYCFKSPGRRLPSPIAAVYSLAMAADDRPINDQFRWGLAAKLFAILILLGAVAVLVTSGLGYVRARDALEETIYNQLTAARQAKTRQVET